ncbi:hypothetical protein CC85DRAFT_287895 [Cutaneotrichosporon oleaginosum]|uniref:Uncharacterized protein n=1 Tax=Cutaneotrichosporon oleaginosum TaxID=879819 RepID=A0A0J1AXH1_9TREE|nr:uncharacterized protein CC85DRAFT_287895 [Cutaneotrichosporon oleaginosum]KLT40014.1 hypothetical protein CC85DRAFT_287895 [Cutaneotrichosporon oleaginosum]TXT13844.1 hypothetical protein COLE_00037 [Cutaneotrichosporon oleaginosum]
MIARSSWRITVPRLRLVARAAHRARYSKTADFPLLEHDGSASPGNAAAREPYGQEYGAGPSCIPYEPPISSPSAAAAAARPGPTATTDAAAAARLARTTTRQSARWLRKALNSISDAERRALQEPMERATANATLARIGIRVQALSRLELHTLLHDLIRLGATSLAVWVCTDVLEHLHPSSIPRKVFSPSTLVALGRLSDGQEIYLPPLYRHPIGRLEQPSIDEQQPRQPSPYLASLLSMLELLQRVRHRRPQELYRLAMIQCINECRPDEAAKIYVGLVEEWIIEGRIAEGADPSDFYAGGGPPREPRSDSPLLAMWFKGVRTWRLPGEALSPHDRLDLWHPHHHSLQERLRGFPMPIPTSPPSLVPNPSMQLLSIIINNLELDPRKLSPADYASSVRALAMLANTVLSRTLPVPAVPSILKAFSDSHMEPRVYPESFTEVPESHGWAYTANTQVHVALVSLMFSPPNYARAAEIERRFSPEDRLPHEVGAARYMLRPLGWKSCLVLIKYAAETLHQPRLLARLFDYMKVTFKEWDMPALNILFRGSSQTRDNALATAVEEKVFGGSLLGNPKATEAGDNKGEEQQPQAQLHALLPKTHNPQTKEQPVLQHDSEVEALLDGIDMEALKADSHTLVALVKHLTVTSQFDRIIMLVYTVLPYLAVNTATPAARVEQLAELTGATISSRGRILPVRLPAELFAAIIAALAKSGNTGLAQRIFRLARSYEKQDYTSQKLKEPIPQATTATSSPQPAEQQALQPKRHPAAYYFIPIHMYTSLIQVYGNETRPRPNAIENSPRGWEATSPYKFMNRQEAGHHMAWDSYNEAMRRWRLSRRLHEHNLAQLAAGEDVVFDVTERELAERTPDGRFFAAIIRVYFARWNLNNDILLDRRGREKVMRLLRDMRDAAVPIPAGLATKLATGQVEGPIFPDIVTTKSLHRPRTYARGVVQEHRKFGLRGGSYDHYRRPPVGPEDPARADYAERSRRRVDRAAEGRGGAEAPRERRESSARVTTAIRQSREENGCMGQDRNEGGSPLSPSLVQ